MSVARAARFSTSQSTGNTNRLFLYGVGGIFCIKKGEDESSPPASRILVTMFCARNPSYHMDHQDRITYPKDLIEKIMD